MSIMEIEIHLADRSTKDTAETKDNAGQDAA